MRLEPHSVKWMPHHDATSSRPPHCPAAGFLPFEFASYTRWSWALQPAYYAAGPVKKLLHTLFRPVKALAWGLFGRIFRWQTRTPGAVSTIPVHATAFSSA